MAIPEKVDVYISVTNKEQKRQIYHPYLMNGESILAELKIVLTVIKLINYL